MPQIEGLKEQQEALKRVTHNLKEVQDMNAFLEQVAAMSKDVNALADYNIMASFTVGKDVKRFKAPMLVSDNRYILEAVQRYKESIAATIRKDATDFRISLSEKETAILDWKLLTEE